MGISAEYVILFELVFVDIENYFAFDFQTVFQFGFEFHFFDVLSLQSVLVEDSVPDRVERLLVQNRVGVSIFQQLAAFFEVIFESEVLLSLFLDVMWELEVTCILSGEVVVFEDINVSADGKLPFFEVEFFEGKPD